MRRAPNPQEESIVAIGRELRLTGDLVYAGSFETAERESTALFFARLFTAMTDDGSGVFINPRTFNGSKLIIDNRIYDVQGQPVGYVVEEFVEEVVQNTLFCGVMLRANGLDDVRRILQTSMLWPMLSAIDARCSACGRAYNYRIPFNWCQHISSGKKQPIVEARVRRLILTENKIRQNLMAMFDAPSGFADIALEPLGEMDEVIVMPGGPEGDLVVTFVVSRDIGYDMVTVGDLSLRAGQRVAIPMSMISDVIDWDLISSSTVVAIDHIGSLRSLFPIDSVPDAVYDEEQDDR